MAAPVVEAPKIVVVPGIPLYKTTMCKQKDTCSRGENCAFAHSEEERKRYLSEENPYYHTRKCDNPNCSKTECLWTHGDELLREGPKFSREEYVAAARQFGSLTRGRSSSRGASRSRGSSRPRTGEAASRAASSHSARNAQRPAQYVDRRPQGYHQSYQNPAANWARGHGDHATSRARIYNLLGDCARNMAVAGGIEELTAIHMEAQDAINELRTIFSSAYGARTMELAGAQSHRAHDHGRDRGRDYHGGRGGYYRGGQQRGRGNALGWQ